MIKKIYSSPKADIVSFDTKTVTSVNYLSAQTTFNKKNKSVINSGNIINF